MPHSDDRDGRAAYALVLAAGSGTRFGGEKLLASFHGRPLVAHVATTLAQAVANGVLAGGVAVIAPGDVSLAWHLDTAGLQLVENPRATSGIGSSLQIGLAALNGPRQLPVGAALIVLADQPLIRLEVIIRLVTEWRAQGCSVRPRYAARPGEPGHPVLLDRGDWSLADQLTGDRGLGPLLDPGNTRAVEIEVPGHNPDVDTPADLSRLEGAG